MRALSLILSLLSAFACAPNTWADEVSRADQFKAAYLFNFVKFVEWPPTTQGEVLTVCFIGGEGVHTTLATNIDTKRAGARRLAVKLLQPGMPTDGCNALYVDATAVQDERVSNAAERPILTVSDAAAFMRHGGMIELFMDSNRLRFSINVNAANKAGLRISSNLLQLAVTVERDSKP